MMREIADAPNVSSFLIRRGLDPAFAASCGVKAFGDTKIAWPLWNGQWKIRDVFTKNMTVAKMGQTDKPLPAVFGSLAHRRGERFHIHLTEGETDALALAQAMHHMSYDGMSVAVPGVHGIDHALRLIDPMINMQDIHITIYPDPDEAGNSLAQAASRFGAYVVQLPEGRDLCEFLGSLDSQHRWPALQLLRHYAASYVPYKAPQTPPKQLRQQQASDVPEGVRAYFFRIVQNLCHEEHIGYADVEKVCCPWHNDPNPSLSIDWSRCIWFCHGCGIGGGVKRWAELANRIVT